MITQRKDEGVLDMEDEKGAKKNMSNIGSSMVRGFDSSLDKNAHF